MPSCAKVESVGLLQSPNLRLIFPRENTTAPLPTEKDYYLRVEITSDLGDRPYIIFIGRSKWCKMDTIEANSYHVGFQMMNPRQRWESQREKWMVR